MSISSDEVNFLVYRYLQESGFLHSAFTFAHESLVARSVVADAEVPPGALLSFLQKGLHYVEVETHLQEDGTERQCDEPFHLLSPHICRVKALQAKAPAGPDGASSIAGTEISPADVRILSNHTSEVFAVAWNPRQDTLATGAADASARIWRVAESRGSDVPFNTLRHSAATAGDKPCSRLKSDVASLEWSPDGTRLATGCSDNRARIWSLDGALLATLSQHTGAISSVRWSPNGQYLLSTGCGYDDKNVVLWDCTTSSNSAAGSGTFEARQQASFHTAPVLDADWATDQTYATCSTDKSVLICNVGERVPTRTLTGHTDEVNSVCWSPSKSLLASGSDDGTVRVWSAAAAQGQDSCVAIMVGGSKGDAAGLGKRNVYKVAWSPTGEGSRNPTKASMLASACFDGTVKVFDAASLKPKNSAPLFTFNRHSALVYAVNFSPDGEYVATAGADKGVYVYSTTDGCLVRSYVGSAAAFDLSWSSTGGKLAVGFASGAVTVLDLRR